MAIPTENLTRASRALQSLSHDWLNTLTPSRNRWSDATLKKHAWVFTMYENFVSGYDKEPWPMDSQFTYAFVHFLASEANYAITTIEDIIISSLKRINIEQTGHEITKEVQEAFAKGIKEVKRSYKKYQLHYGKEPAIIYDVEHIIKTTPEGLNTKARETSLFLLAVSTGARAVTCANILLSDFIVLLPSSTEGNLILQIKYRVTKGLQNWDHIVSVEGNLTTKSDLNILYWLNQHLIKEFKLDLSNFED